MLQVCRLGQIGSLLRPSLWACRCQQQPEHGLSAPAGVLRRPRRGLRLWTARQFHRCGIRSRFLSRTGCCRRTEWPEDGILLLEPGLAHTLLRPVDADHALFRPLSRHLLRSLHRRCRLGLGGVPQGGGPAQPGRRRHGARLSLLCFRAWHPQPRCRCHRPTAPGARPARLRWHLCRLRWAAPAHRHTLVWFLRRRTQTLATRRHRMLRRRTWRSECCVQNWSGKNWKRRS